MTQRIDHYQASPDAMQAIIALEIAISLRGLKPELTSLVKLRVSQINRCAFCVDIEAAQARRAGETVQRLDALAVWQHSLHFSERERAVLAWAETLTTLEQHEEIERLLQDLRTHLSDMEIGDLTLTIVAINSWNRMGVGFRRALS
jgi:AhpD family alkylhydroperoxidase